MNHSPNDAHIARPTSAVPAITGIAGLVGFFLLFLILQLTLPEISPWSRWGIFLAGVALPMYWVEYRRYRHQPYQLDFIDKSSFKEKLIWKFIGSLIIITLWGIMLLFYSLTTPYEYGATLDALMAFLPFLLIYYLYFLCRHQASDWAPTTLMTLGRHIAQRHYQRQYWWPTLRSHLIKAIFIPLMINASYLWSVDLFELPQRPTEFYLWLCTIIFFLDTLYALIGYFSNSVNLQSHTRSSNPYLSAWIVTMICYAPFTLIREKLNLLSHLQGESSWFPLFVEGSLTFYLWGALLLFFHLSYLAATIIFGIRFSNLTNRGIITNGLYRYVKHPAYLSKNIFWWILLLPILTMSNWKLNLLMITSLLLTNLIYFCRAKAEERHLKADPTYRQYLLWIDQHGLFAKLVRRFSISNKK